jgi:hypothetical protein
VRLAQHNARLVSWIWTPHDMEPFIGHLQTLLHARLAPDDDDAWFFFYQPSYLGVLHRTLPEPVRRYVFGPCHAWWTFNTHAELVELPGEGLPVPPAWDAFPLPADVVAALHREVMPQQVLAWLTKSKPELLRERGENARLCEIASFVERAMGHGITDKMDMAAFVAYGLRYRVDYDGHPAVQDALVAAGTSGKPLAYVYRSLDGKVWQELAGSAQQREADHAARQWRDDARAAGQIAIKVRFVNHTSEPVSNIRIESPTGPDGEWQRLARRIAGAGLYSENYLEHTSVTVPVPGQPMTLAWNGANGWWDKKEIIIGGELPRDGQSGMLVVNLLTADATARMYADEPPITKRGF